MNSYIFVLIICFCIASTISAYEDIVESFISPIVAFYPPFACPTTRRRLGGESDLSSPIRQAIEDAVRSYTEGGADVVASESLQAVMSGAARVKGKPSSLLTTLAASEVFLCVGLTLNGSPPMNVGEVICNCSASVKKPLGSCSVVEIISKGLGCSTLLSCPVETPIPATVDSFPDEAFSFPLEEFSQGITPSVIPADVITREMTTYYLAFNAIQQLKYATDVSFCQGDYLPTIPTWERSTLVKMIEPKGKGDANVSLPLSQVFKRASKSVEGATDFLIVTRGTLTESEWAAGFSYNQVPVNVVWDGVATHHGSSSSQNPSDVVMVHRGYLGLASTIFQALQPSLTEATKSGGTIGNVIFTGFSLGGAVTTILGHLFASKYTNIKPNVIAFAPPRAGSSDFVEVLARTTRFRFIHGEFDIVPEIPCQHQPSCPSSVVSVPTGKDTDTTFLFGELHGAVKVNLSDMPDVWQQRSQPSFDVAAWHSCAYPCWTSTLITPAQPVACYPPGGVPSHIVNKDLATCGVLSATTSAASLLQFIGA